MNGRTFLLLVFCALLCSCSQNRKVAYLRMASMGATISPAEDVTPAQIRTDIPDRDTLKVLDPQGREVLLMKAVKDENGEMVASDVIDPVVVTASFKNVAERHGKIDLKFDVLVPSELLDSRWQIRLVPVLELLGERTRLDSILITGEGYRKDQIRGYKLYDRFLHTIKTDSMDLVRMRDYRIFMSRERRDVMEEEAVEHYTDPLMLAINNRRIASKAKKYRKFVKSPFITEGLRLDTIVNSSDGTVRYAYTQTIDARPDLRKSSISLGGAIYDIESELYRLKDSEPVTFYISSLGTLLDRSVRYRTRIVERRVYDNSVCWIEFAQGRSDVQENLGNNPVELKRIKENISQIVRNEEFDVDSIVVTASSSPEGSYALNNELSLKRSASVCEHFRTRRIRYVPRNVPENWAMLTSLVEADTLLTRREKDRISEIIEISAPDARETALSSLSCYRYLREVLYPRLRTVKFEFYLHRRGMVKDTVHTTEPDTAYMRGVDAMDRKDYKSAVAILREYRDFNTALAYASLDYNASALDVLDGLPDSDRVNYLKALILSRRGEEKASVEAFLKACRQNPSFVHRGNLDPEISHLINKYRIDDQIFNNYEY